MWRWAISSSRRAPRLWLIALLALAAAAPAARAKVLLRVEEALTLAFPGAEVEKQTLFLSDEQVRRATELAGVEGVRPLVVRYTARRDGEPAGIAYFDTHRVRTLRETLMVVVGPSGEIERLEVIAFAEPEEYLPRDAWYRQFLEQSLSPELEIKRRIRPITGATLTARATLAAARRVLALHQVLEAAP